MVARSLLLVEPMTGGTLEIIVGKVVLCSVIRLGSMDFSPPGAGLGSLL